VTLELEARTHVLAHPLVVIDDEHRRTDLLAGAGPGRLEELVQVRPAVAAMAARGVEGGNAALIGPLPDRALRDAEVLRRLTERQPIRLGGRRATTWKLAIRHSEENLPKLPQS